MKDSILRNINVVLTQMRRYGLSTFEVGVDMYTKKYTNVKYVCITISYIGRRDADPAGAFEFKEHIMEFCGFPALKCNAKTIAKCYKDALSRFGIKISDITIASPDGESAGLAALNIVDIPYEIFISHQIARPMLYAGGEVAAVDSNSEYLKVRTSFRQVSSLVRKSPMVSKLLKETQQALDPSFCGYTFKEGQRTRWFGRL